MKKTLLALSTVLFFACGGSKEVAEMPSTQTLAMNYTEATVDQLNSGKVLFEKGCNQCHGLKKSYGVAAEKLTKVVPNMVGKANKKAGQTLIDEKGGENVLHYLLALNSK
jgi:mono/diheme cytochrome c family protein